MPLLFDLEAMRLCVVHGSRALTVPAGSRPLNPGNAAFGLLLHPPDAELECLLTLESDVDYLNGDEEQGTELD